MSHQRLDYEFVETSQRRAAAGDDRVRSLTQTQEETQSEVGADYEFAVGPGRLKLIGLYRAGDSEVDTAVTTAFAGSNLQTGDRLVRLADEVEIVGRAEYRFTRGGSDWELSAEQAFNELDGLATLFALDDEGRYQQVALPGGDATVSEDRTSVAVGVTRALPSAVVVQAMLGAEDSTLRYEGPVGLERNFLRPKGRVIVSWQASPRLRLNAKLERRIGQISFFDFLASVNLADDRENAGNPNLAPPQSWDVDLEANRDFGAAGSTTVRLYGRWIEDLIDQIPIGETGEAPGNLSEATVYGVEWKSTVDLTRMGWTGARVDTLVQLQTSDVWDPITGRNRRISNNLDRSLELALRHDVPGTNWAWGGRVFELRRAPDFRLGETAEYYGSGVTADLYAERKNLFGLTVRATVSNAIGGEQNLDRTVYVGRRDGPVLFEERRRREIGPTVSLALMGRF